MARATAMPDAMSRSASALLRLLQLSSPALPIGGFAHSLGLEHAAARGWVHDEASALEWIGTLLSEVQARTDVPVFARMYRAWGRGDNAKLDHWAAFLLATREAAELARADRQLGISLARLLLGLGLAEARRWTTHPNACLAAPFALAACRWDVPLRDAALGLLFSWAQGQVAAAVKIVPLGQTSGQRVLSACVERVKRAVACGLVLRDAEMGASAPRLAIAAALHETQYSRLYVS